MRKAVIRKSISTLFAISVGVICVNMVAYSYYGIQDLVTPEPKTTPTNLSNKKDDNKNQQAVIASLLQKAKAQNANNPSVRQQQNPQVQQGEKNPGVSDEAFANTVRNLMPLSPTQIKTMRYLFDQSQRAATTYPGVPPKPTSASVIVNLSPGATPPVIRLSAGFVTSLVFLDSTGAPWPIQAYDLGNPQSFSIQWDKKSNSLLVQALNHYKSGNLAVILKGLNTPVMITLLPGQNAVDYRVDLRIPGIGPHANPVLSGLPGTESPQLLEVLNGVPPSSSKPLTITGGDCQGWLLNGHIYLRTRLTVLSPGWISTMSSGDGTHAYELQSTPVVLASARGKLVKLMIKGL